LTTEKPIHVIAEEQRSTLATPYYLIDEARLRKNLERIATVRERSGAKSVLALKCFSTWSVFDMMRPYMDGTTSSSLFEARLGHEKFGKEVHAYSVAWSDADVDAIAGFATKVIFNSVSQLKRFAPRVSHLPIGLRLNPGVSHSGFDLADPARRYCRLGVADVSGLEEALPLLSGVMFHCNCENADIGAFGKILDTIAAKFGPLLEKLDWVSLGGGIFFTKDGYPLDDFCDRLKAFSKRFKVQVYLEPGEATITNSGFLVTQVLDVVRNEIDVAVVDAAVETHMLDLLIYNQPAKIEVPAGGTHTYQIAGRTCLAGDIFGTASFPAPLNVGDLVTFADAAGYTMVKKNWFNGVAMPSIVVRRLDGRVELVRQFSYDDYASQLS
jgi:carboxynorspermidine decarboxylase